MLKTIVEDIQAVRKNDPAARNIIEVLFLYPGFHATLGYRMAHSLWKKKHYFLSRWVSRLIHSKTGIDIHPAAQIGKGLFIDHGTGVVIGETCKIGDYVTIYQGVTLGGTGKESGQRHPTLGHHVLLSAGSKVIGNISIGNFVKVGAGSVVLENVPSHVTVVGIPGKIVRRKDFMVNLPTIS